MRLRHFGLAILLPACPVSAQCPDNGQVLVMKQEKGIELIRFFGRSSIKGFFPGPDFVWVKANKHNPEPTFWVDGLLVQWMFFPKREFMGANATSDQDTLEGYYRYETEYLKQTFTKTGSQLNLARFLNTEEHASDGTKHTFLIWSATPQGDATKQYWVATVHPRGVVSMSVIPRNPADEGKMRTLIDSYMASYAILRPDEEASYMKALHTFEQSKVQPQVQTIQRNRTKMNETSIPFPSPVGSNSR